MANTTKFKPFSPCFSSTGWFCTCCCRQSKIQRELGVGVSIYFKQLKNLVIILFLCTLLSLPAYALFWSGRSLNNPDKISEDQKLSLTVNTFIASISLANLGEKSININKLELSKPTQGTEMFCETGKIGRISSYGIAVPLETSQEIEYFADTYCALEVSQANIQLYDKFCLMETHCQFKWQIPAVSTYDTLCRKAYQGSRTDLNFAKYALYLEYECDISEIELYYFGAMKRTRLANIVIACDALIILLLAFNTCWLGFKINSEQHDAEKKFVHMTDFAVRVKNLPGKDAFDNLDQLRAQLVLHLSQVVSKEPQVFLKQGDVQEVDASEIVSVHFSQKNFEKYRVLLRIEQQTKEGQKMRTKQSNSQGEDFKKKLEIKIRLLRESILQQVEKYVTLHQKDDSNEVKNAFVVFRSMEGAARAI